ncbi:MAG TPA: alanine racemase [Candidatus Scybalocola faecavium]|nr:alanine racemase [Candidatus Scybalocola faecavium]
MDRKQIQQILHQYPTPLYVFDIPVLLERIAYLKKMLPEHVSLCYAVKANTFILSYIKDVIGRFEVCSPGELRICQMQGLPPEKLVISGVYKTPELMEELIGDGFDAGIYTVESVEQFGLLKKLADRYGQNIRLLLRLTSGSQFGVEADQIREMIRTAQTDPFVEIRGIQYFSGTQKTSIKRLAKELAKADHFLQSLKEEFKTELPELEFGPGFPVAYFKGEDFNEEEFLTEFSDLLNGLSHKGHITLELGRSIAASCGTYMTRVVDTKTNKGQNYAIMDGGIHQMVYYGQSMAMKQPLCQLFPDGTGKGENLWNLCGSLCTMNDILVKQLPADHVKIGDVVLFKNTGAYAMTEGIALFLSRDLPRILIRENDRVLCVRDGYQTYPLNLPGKGL